MTELYLKNMVCDRCILVVREEVEKLGLRGADINLGLVKLPVVTEEQQKLLEARLLAHGFEVLDCSKLRLIERVKSEIIRKIHHSEYLQLNVAWSDYLADKFSMEYNSLSFLFSTIEGNTIEQYIIHQKIERVKELLFYDEFNLSEISYRLGYSSLQHLSMQFKKITGKTPSKFKAEQNIEKSRKSLDAIL